MAVGDYDLLIVTHDQLDMMKMKPETQKRFIEHEIAELECVMEMAEQEGGKRGNRIVKRLAKAKERLQERILEAIEGGRKDDVICFEELGCDFLMVDESHFYKNLSVHTKQDRIKGIPTSRSDRATNMYMRTSWLQEQHGGRGVVFGTGTPLSNSLCELFILQQYLQRGELMERNIHTFDAWAAVFTEVVSRLEVTVDGLYAPVARLAAFVNLPELLGLARQILDVKIADNIPGIQKPQKEDHVVTAPINDQQKAFLKQLQQRARAVRSSKPVKGGDNMLSITTDARKLSADARLVMSGAADDESSKLNELVRNVLAIYHEKPEQRTQLIFSDLGVYENNWNFSIYRDVKRKLVEGGIPADKIVDFSTLTDTGRERAMERLRRAEAVIGLGSTQKMGTGVNVQEYVYALHLYDVPWLPAFLEQRIGRGWRHGNLHYTWGIPIKVFRYVAIGSFDQFNWQIIDTKIRFINQIMTEGTAQRKYKEVDGEELSAAQIMAIASGNPDLLLKVQLDEQVAELQAAKRRHDRAQIRLKDEALWARRSIEKVTREIAALESDAAHARATDADDFRMTVEGATYTHRKQAAINLTVACSRDSFFNGERHIASLRGFNIIQRGYDVLIAREGEYGFKVNAENPLGTIASVESVLRNIAGRIEGARRDLRAYETNLDKTVEATGKPFRQAAELEQALDQLAEVARRLKASGESDSAEGEQAA